MIYEEDAKKERRNRNVVPYHFSGNKISLSKIGDIKVIVHRQIPDRFDIKTVSITKKADGYYVTLSLDDQTVTTIKPDFKADKIVGIDVGLIDFFVTSDNERIAAPKFLRQAEGKGTPKNKLSSNHRLVGTQQCSLVST